MKIKQEIEEWAWYILGFILASITFIVVWIRDRFVKEKLMTCEHGAVGNSIWLLFKTCGKCGLELRENHATDEFVREYTKECITRYEKLLRRLSHE